MLLFIFKKLISELFIIPNNVVLNPHSRDHQDKPTDAHYYFITFYGSIRMCKIIISKYNVNG